MASIDRSDPVILGHVLAEHRELFNLIQSVRAAFAAPERPSPERRNEVLLMLRSLRCHLRDHFTREECGGFLEEAVTRLPRLSAAMRAILLQHPALLENLDGVISSLESAPEHSESWTAAGKAYEAFACQMAAHEQRENAVIQEGYCEDLGLAE